jgi:hypothetical protein
LIFLLACPFMQLIFWLIAIVLAGGAAYWVYRADKKRAVPYPWLTSALRGLVVLLTLLLILIPDIIINKNFTEKPVVLLLQDNSRSVGNALGNDSAAYRKNMEALTLRLSGQYKVITWGFGASVQNDSAFHYTQPATDISAALARAQEFFGMQNLGAVILASDGRFNQGTNPAYQELALHGALYTVGLGDSSKQKDIRINRVYANKWVTINSSFEIRADIVAELCNGYNNSVLIKDGDELLASVPVSINSDRYDRSVAFTVKAGKAGLHHYTLTLPEANGEKNTANNRKDIFVEVVDAQKKILIVSSAPHPDVNAIKDALSGVESYKVSICTADNLPATLNDYNVIVLHGLPSLRNRIGAQILAAKKPTWFILTGQTDIQGMNGLQTLTHTSIAPTGPHDMQLAFNTSFNAFTLPQHIQSVTDKMPPLISSTGNINVLPGSNILYTQRTAAGIMPAWIMQHGSVPTAILAGEGIWRWRLYEFKNFNDHSVVDECIRQTIAFLAANNNEKPFNVVMPKYVWSDQEPVSMNAYLLNANNEQVNTPDAQLTITDSAGRKQNFSFERSGNAYNLNAGIWAGGTYTYSAKTTYNNKELSANGTFVVESMPLELMETGADYPLLYNLARKYNGGFVTAANVASLYDSISHNEHVKPVIQTNSETVPLVDRKWFFFVILIIAVGEWLLRKYWLAQ